MTPVVVDSSVAIKWFVPEDRSERALRLLDGTFELIAPDLLVPECANVLWKKTTRGEISAGEARLVLRALGAAPVRLVASRDIIDAAFEIATSLGRTVYDSLFVTLAVARECVLVTGDHRMARALAAGPLAGTVRSLDDWEPG